MPESAVAIPKALRYQGRVLAQELVQQPGIRTMSTVKHLGLAVRS